VTLPVARGAGDTWREEALAMLACIVAVVEATAPARPDDPVGFAAILLLGLGIMALAVGRPVARN
jgi:hypothetical protein